MPFINAVAGLFGISGTELIIIAVIIVLLVAAWAAIRAFLRVAFRLFALGCVTILGIALALYIVFWIIGPLAIR